jgi:hypothetical protein
VVTVGDRWMMYFDSKYLEKAGCLNLVYVLIKLHINEGHAEKSPASRQSVVMPFRTRTRRGGGELGEGLASRRNYRKL